MRRSKKNLYLGKWPEVKVPLIVLSLLAGAYYVQEWSKRQKLYQCPRYTIAYVTQIKTSDVVYRYTLNDQEYRGYWQIKARSSEEADRAGAFTLNKDVGRNLAGQRFLVRTSCRNPEVSEAYWLYAVPDSIQFAPAGGWEALPGSFSRTTFNAD